MLAHDTPNKTHKILKIKEVNWYCVKLYLMSSTSFAFERNLEIHIRYDHILASSKKFSQLCEMYWVQISLTQFCPHTHLFPMSFCKDVFAYSAYYVNCRYTNIKRTNGISKWEGRSDATVASRNRVCPHRLGWLPGHLKS